MNPFFAYLIKSSISLALLYCLFRVCMRNDRNHSLNRFLLLGILLVSAIIPFLNIQFFYEEVPFKQAEVIRGFIAEPVFDEPVATAEPNQVVAGTSSFSINWWFTFYVAIISAFALRIIFGVFRVLQIIKSAERYFMRRIIVAVVKDLIQPFTFINKVVLSEKDFAENRNVIVTHEHAHIKYLHVIDLIVCELFTVVHFFNPFMWMLRHDLKLIHEYQADEAVLNKGIDAKKYQLLVLQKAVGERRFALANHFTQKPILKRLKMMQQKNRKQWAAVKLVLFLPLLVILLQAFARPAILAEKAGELVPNIMQKDSAEVWLDNWTIEGISSINGGIVVRKVEVKPPPPGHSQSDLPKYDKSRDGHPIPSKNIFPILINTVNDVLAANKMSSQKEIKVGVERFLTGNHPNDSKKEGPEYEKKELPILGERSISRGVIVVRHDRDSDKSFVNNLMKEIGKAHLAVRKQMAKKEFGEDYFSLSAEKRQVVDLMIPIRVSVERPKSFAQAPPPPPPVFRVELTAGDIKVSGEKVSKNELSVKAKDFLRKFGDSYHVWLCSKADVDNNRINDVKEQLFFAGMSSEKMKCKTIN